MPSVSVESSRIARLVAILAGLAGIVLCALTPLLPVTQSTATIQWPQSAGREVGDITAPLVSGAPLSLQASVPCTAVAKLPPKGGVLFSTNPAEGIDAARNGLFIRANADSVIVAFRDTVAAVAPRAAVAAGSCSVIRAWADPGAAGAEFVGIPGAAGTLPPDKKPQVSGVFTDLKGPAEPGLSARIDVDTRFITRPTPLKLAVMVAGVLCVIASIAALAAMDRGWTVRGVAAARRRLTRHWPADIGVIGVLLVWHVIGAISSDDGYNLTIARISGEAGYNANYYRYFGASEAPFDWYQSVLAGLASVSTASVWMRLPATAAAIGSWLILSHRVLPRLGSGRGGLAGDRVAVATAGAVFLAAWLPFNNGLRPEPLIAFGALAVWMLVERTIATRRLAPTAVAIVVAVFCATLAPQGLMAVAPLLVGARSIARIIGARRAADGALAAPAALAAALSLFFVVVFRDQTLATVAESVRIKYVVGPTISWYQDFLRYYFLTVEDHVEASLTRRFAVLVMLVCLFAMLVMLLRKGRIPGTARGPVWRLIGSTALGLLLLTFTPTKWAVQFGAFAGLAAALGGVTAFAFATVGLHSRRNLALYVTALLFVVAWATSGINGWFYVGNYGVPWYDRQPVLLHRPVTSMFLAMAIITALIAGWLHFRIDYAGHTEVKDTRRNRLLASTPLLAVSLIMVLLAVGSMAKGFAQRYPAYTNGKASVRALAAGFGTKSCAMADEVLVEADTNAGMLKPAPGQKWGKYGPLGGENPVGFSPNGVSDNLDPVAPFVANPGTVNSDGSPNKPNVGIGFTGGTGGGYGPVGVNGSKVFLPFGLDPKTTPVMGSYKQNTLAAKATSAWYELPPRSPDRPLVTVTAAGAIWYYDNEGEFHYGQSLKLQWGVRQPDGTFKALDKVYPIDTQEQLAWRNLRFPVGDAPAEANVVRIVADDPNLSIEQWFGFTPPRAPILQTAQQLLGDQTPVFMDIASAAHFPCQRPFAEHLGIAEVPQYRIRPNLKQVVVSSNMWQTARAGGPYLFIQALLSTTTVPTYLRDDWYRDWGEIERYIRVVPAAQSPNAVVDEGSTRVFGWSRNGPIRALP
ncbi:MAG: arabinosyltransferase domain-containing protein [Mycobacterium sp.]